MSEQAGIDTRQRGFFWGPNELIKHWVPLIGLDGVGLLNSYDVWCDRRQESNTKGFAFPTRLQEATFYGVSKSTLAVLTAILEAVGWLHVKAEKRTTGHGRGGGGTTYTVKNFYEIINRDWTLTLEDVFAVLRLADEDNRVFKRIKHIFRPDFAPIDSKDNPWLAFLPQLRQDPLWQRLAEKAQKRSASYRARRHGTDQDNPNRRSLPVATGWNPPCNRRSLVHDGGNPSAVRCRDDSPECPHMWAKVAFSVIFPTSQGNINGRKLPKDFRRAVLAACRRERFFRKSAPFWSIIWLESKCSAPL